MSKQPAFMFYPGSWLKDPNLCLCSAGARGVWIDILCLMAESESPGILQTNGKPWTAEQVIAALRGDSETNAGHFRELVENNVIHVLENGAYTSNLMRRIETQKLQWRDSKRKTRGTKDSEKKCPANVPINVPPLSRPSSSSSSIRVKKNPPTPLGGNAVPVPAISPRWEQAAAVMKGSALRDSPAFQVAWLAWSQYRSELRAKLTPSTIARQIKALEKMGADKAIASIERSIECGWRGIFDSDKPATSKRPGSAVAKPGKYDGM